MYAIRSYYDLFVDVQEIINMHAAVEWAGVPQDLVGIEDSVIVERIARYVGAQPSIRDSYNLKAAEAWALVVFAETSYNFV